MDLKLKTLVLVSAPAILLAACQVTPKLEDAQYWQRKNATSSLYLRGPKAQETLHKDIATCVTEIDELERMAPLRAATPADTQDGKVPDPSTAEGRMKAYETPKKDGPLYAEHFDYTDFEGCMDFKGWERVESLPYVQADQARDEYLKNVYGYKYQSDTGQNFEAQKSSDAYATSSPGTVVNN